MKQMNRVFSDDNNFIQISSTVWNEPGIIFEIVKRDEVLFEMMFFSNKNFNQFISRYTDGVSIIIKHKTVSYEYRYISLTQHNDDGKPFDVKLLKICNDQMCVLSLDRYFMLHSINLGIDKPRMLFLQTLVFGDPIIFTNQESLMSKLTNSEMNEIISTLKAIKRFGRLLKYNFFTQLSL